MKLFKNPIITFIIGIILTSIVGVAGATYLYHAKDVSYKNTNVESAINDLYNKTDECTSVPSELVLFPDSDNTKLGGISWSLTADRYDYFVDSSSYIYFVSGRSNTNVVGYSNVTIDFTKYNYMWVDYDLVSGHSNLTSGIYIGVSDDKDANLDNFIGEYYSTTVLGQTVSRKQIMIDISGITGKHYLKFGVHHFTEMPTDTSTANIYQIKLIK